MDPLRGKITSVDTRSSVYIETSVIGYATSWPSTNVLTAAKQAISRSWFQESAGEYQIYVSQPVLIEISSGDPKAAQERLDFVADFIPLEATAEAFALAGHLLDAHALPEKAAVDALHIAISAISGIDYLLTWNCKHIANVTMRHTIERTCRLQGFEPPLICTPEELPHGE